MLLRNFICFCLALALANVNFAESTETSAKDAYAKAKSAVAQQEWDEAIHAIITAIKLDGSNPKDSYKELLVRIIPDYYRVHEEAIRNALKANDLQTMEVHVKNIESVYKDALDLKLTEGRGKKKAPIPIPQPSADVLDLFRTAKEAAARQKYDRGLDYLAAGSFRDAAISFRESNAIVPGFEDASAKYEECRARVLRRVALCAIAPNGGISSAELAESVCAGMMEFVKTSPEAAGSFEFIELLSPAEFRMQCGSAGVPLTTASNRQEVVSAAKKLQSLAAVLVISIQDAKAYYPGVRYEDRQVSGPVIDLKSLITPNNDGLVRYVTIVFRVYENAGAVEIVVGYSLHDLASNSELKVGTVTMQDTDTKTWARTDADFHVAKQILDDEDEELLKREPSSPMSQQELARRAVQKGTPLLIQALSSAL